MGLDMYLDARTNKYFSKYNTPDEEQAAEVLEFMAKCHIPLIEGLDTQVISVDLNQRVGYWRKHANLHGFIVSNFAEEDDCEPIWLNAERIEAIIEAIADDELIETEGFFFGRSPSVNSDDPDEVRWAKETKENDLKIFQLALKLNKDMEIYYSASW